MPAKYRAFTTQIIEPAITLFVTLLFVYASVSKLVEYKNTRSQLEQAHLLKPIAPEIAILVPVLELATVVMLLIPRQHLKGLYASLALMLLFTFYICSILLFSHHTPCSCGGIISHLSWTQHLLFNILITGIIIIAIRTGRAVRQHIPVVSFL